jgi:ferric-dicitrate binding protein FerR (iron transport regulator)
MEKKQLEKLLQGFVRGELTADELALFSELIRGKAHDELFKSLISRSFEDPDLRFSAETETGERIWERILRHQESTPPRWQRRSSVRILSGAVAASILLGFFSIAYVFFVKRDAVSNAADRGNMVLQVPKQTMAEKVTLMLADGSMIIVDELEDGAVDNPGGIPVIKADGSIRFGQSSGKALSNAYNTVTTPRGSRYQVLLADGSKVWLNAASSIRFPVTFDADERRVEIRGQAYFEVAHDHRRPFRVKVGNAEVEVLGTHFDVMAYEDEDVIHTTLLEGAVRFRGNAGAAVLKPGQQSVISARGGPVRVKDDVDVASLVAWKEGLLEFIAADIGMVCRSLSRSFDATVTYDEHIDEIFFAKFPVNTKLSVVLQALEMTGKVRFERKGEAIHAIPVKK